MSWFGLLPIPHARALVEALRAGDETQTLTFPEYRAQGVSHLQTAAYQ